MEIANLKEYILDNNFIIQILEELGCHHIKQKDGYIQCANPDGDNQAAITVYENANLTVVNYTRDIAQGKKTSDIIDLVQYVKNENFFNALKWICDIVDIDYYKDWDENVPESLIITKILMEMQSDGEDNYDEKPLSPISETILGYYKKYVNNLF